MNKKTFLASNWLQKDINSGNDLSSSTVKKDLKDKIEPKVRFPTFTLPVRGPNLNANNNDKFSPTHCFVPNWKGDSLISKSVIKFERLMSLVQHDVKNELFKTKDFPKTIKLGLYSEFLSYAEALGLHFEDLDDLGRFWNLIDPEQLNENLNLSSPLKGPSW